MPASNTRECFSMRLAQLGSRIGNWNDQRFSTDVGDDAPRVYRLLDSLAGWLCTRGEDR